MPRSLAGCIITFWLVIMTVDTGPSGGGPGVVIPSCCLVGRLDLNQCGPERHLLDLASPDRARFSGAPFIPSRQLTSKSVRPGFSRGSPLGGRGDGARPVPTATPHRPTESAISETCRPARVCTCLNSK